jgi:hypothetical protein
MRVGSSASPNHVVALSQNPTAPLGRSRCHCSECQATAEVMFHVETFTNRAAMLTRAMVPRMSPDEQTSR